MYAAPLYLKKHADRRLRAGHLWIYSNEIDVSESPLHTFDAGQAVTVYNYDNKPLGTGYVNPHALICGRLISRNPSCHLDFALLVQRLKMALLLRERLFPKPYYRLVYGDSDGLPGLVVDRFGDVIVAQITTAGMERLRTDILAALETVLQPVCIVLRNDTSMRALENLPEAVEIAAGVLPDEIILEENGVKFYVPVLEGQKTGWFYDHRANRAALTKYVENRRVLDIFSYGGAWGIQAAVAGANEVYCIDSSAKALAHVKANAALNHVTEHLQILSGDAFDLLKSLRNEGQKFDVVILDPPAFIKRKKDQTAGELAYRRLNQLAMQVLNEDGILVSASCSLHLQRDTLINLLNAASWQLGRGLQILEQGHQSPDHPIHPAIPETAYLKAFICRVVTA